MNKLCFLLQGKSRFLDFVASPANGQLHSARNASFEVWPRFPSSHNCLRRTTAAARSAPRTRCPNPRAN